MRLDLGGMIFPDGLYCVVCGKFIDNTRKYGLCDHCIKRMNFGCTEFFCNEYYYEGIECSPCFDYGFSAMGYGLYERRLIFNLKYDGKTYMAPILAYIIYDAIYAKAADSMIKTPRVQNLEFWNLLRADMIIPVPIHKRRLKERGFNQSERIANHLGKKMAIPVDSKSLVRAKETHTQRALSAEERRNNMEDVFCIPEHRKYAIENKSVILLDDIYTTGATANSCAKVLKQNGAKKIYILTVLFAGNRHHLMVK